MNDKGIPVNISNSTSINSYNESGSPVLKENQNLVENLQNLTLESEIEQTVIIIKPDAMTPEILPQILSMLKHHKFSILYKKKLWLDPETVAEFYKEHAQQPFYQSIINYLSS